MDRRHHPTPDTATEESILWQAIINHQNSTFYTAKGLSFTYIINILPDGTLGNELLFSRKAKTITRSTVNIAYQRVKERQGERMGEGQGKGQGDGHGTVSGPKQLGMFGAS